MTPVFSVSEFNEITNNHLTLLGKIVVEGEISAFNINQNKWIFATLKDSTSSVEIFAVAFQIGNFRTLKPGMRVHVTGIPRVHQRSGRFSLMAQSIVPTGVGDQLLTLQELKDSLTKEGLFDPARKRPLPKYPQTIALITAANSQAFQDFVKIANDRSGGHTIYHIPVQVQGDSAVLSIIRAVELANTTVKPDLIVITRGGGSNEDLKAFDDERLVRSIFASAIPTLTAIGHEGNTSLSELASDQRASTPTNAAMIAIPDRNSTTKHLSNLLLQASHHLQTKLNINNLQVDSQLNLLHHHFLQSTQTLHQQLKQFSALSTTLKQRTLQASTKTNNLSATGYLHLFNRLKMKVQEFNHLQLRLEQLNYQHTLSRGFSIVRNSKNQIITTSKQVNIGDQLTITLDRGTINSQVQ